MSDTAARSRRSLPVLNSTPRAVHDPDEVPSKAEMYRQMFVNVARKVVRAPISLHTWGALRRTIMPQLLPDELLYRWRPYRKGECNRCGACCAIQFQCSFMVQDEANLTHCRIYQTEHAPQACLQFPFDPIDLHMLQREIGHKCVFYYEGEPEPIPRLEYAWMILRHVYEKSRRARRRRAVLSAD